MTQKISRAELDDALNRTKSGTRVALRSEPELGGDSFAGPRDDGPEVTIVCIETMELSVIDPASLPPPREALVTSPQASPPSPSLTTPSLLASRRSLTSSLTRRFHVTPQLAFLVGVALVSMVALAAILGFFAGRITGHGP